jgi:A/G-specific adenine glycosylase
MEKFPTIHHLANAEEQEVLKLWEGLGYYSRARNIHKTSKILATIPFPTEVSELQKLHGIGPYSAGAIASIAFQKPNHAIDGNVMRVYSRLLRIQDDIALPNTRKIFEDVVTETISHEDPSAFNQGLMELGATVCTPTTPKCFQCPVQTHCEAFHHQQQTQFPIKSKKEKPIEQWKVALIVSNPAGKIVISKRSEHGLLGNLYEFPTIDVQSTEESDLTLEHLFSKQGLEVVVHESIGSVKHVFSHLKWHIDVRTATLKQSPKDPYVVAELEDLKVYPIPKVYQKVWNVYRGNENNEDLL